MGMKHCIPMFLLLAVAACGASETSKSGLERPEAEYDEPQVDESAEQQPTESTVTLTVGAAAVTLPAEWEILSSTEDDSDYLTMVGGPSGVRQCYLRSRPVEDTVGLSREAMIEFRKDNPASEESWTNWFKQFGEVLEIELLPNSVTNGVSTSNAKGTILLDDVRALIRGAHFQAPGQWVSVFCYGMDVGQPYTVTFPEFDTIISSVLLEE